MAIKTLYLVKNDLQPYYYITAKDAFGNAIDLTGATIYCTMKNMDGGTVKISRQTTGIVIDPDQVNNKGQFRYEWQGGDTDTPSTEDTSGAYKDYKDRIPYHIEFEVNPSAGGKFTLPNPDTGTAAVVIMDSLDTI